ncbi:OmpA family protein [Zhongshania arctica]|uniref:OmpA family protein n=1 Tax=Zhongshania arctica TaxID=3238302 RepID=A0ABV3TT72_9GAMM|tara:strand:+ start:332 stop:1201 length:870 start_codon:yes stop_codon:yes gene_type:complete
MMEHKTNYSYITALFLAVLLFGGPAHAGLLRDVLTQTGILAIVTPVTTAVGIELDDTITTLDGVVDGVLGGDGAATDLSMSAQESSNLLAMDAPVLSVVSNVVAVIFAPAPADDQPALVPLVNLDPVFVVGQIQTKAYRCSDGDGDGVCDQDDQCLKTPAGIKVLGNGCYLDGPRGVALEGVYFANDSQELSVMAQQVLRNVAEVIRQSSANLIEVGGFTDNVGNADYNLRLSAARAMAVRDYLYSLGIERSRLQVKGYGENSPRAENTSAEGRAKNRRVELKIVERDQ